MTIAILLAAISFLIFVNAFYVAAQFSSVVVRRPRLAQIAEEGNPQASFVLGIVETPRRLDTYIATCQVGITISSLALGFYGQTRILAMLAPILNQLNPGIRVLATSVTAIAILLLLTIFQVILGELLPKNIGLQYPERLALLTASGMRWSMRILGPLIWFFNGSGMLILRLIGVDMPPEHSHVHSAAEIEILVEESSAGGVLDDEERRLLVNTLRLRNVTAQQVMIPRNSMIAAPLSATCSELFTLLAESPYSRLPIYSDSIDSIVGVVHLKDLMCAVHMNLGSNDTDSVTVGDCVNPVLYIPESAAVEEVMNLLQEQRQHLAIVVDEYGGTAGMITLEDLVEEIVGEFDDEFDVASRPIELVDGNRLRIPGDVSVDDLENLLGVNLQAPGFETVGGLVLAVSGRIPESGETVIVHGILVSVESVVDNRIVYVSVPITQEQVEVITDYLKEVQAR